MASPAFLLMMSASPRRCDIGWEKTARFLPSVIKLMAGLLGVGFDDLRRREQAYQKQRVRRLQITAGMFAVLFIAAIVAAVYAVTQKRAVQRTLSQSDLQLAVQARENDDLARAAAYLARSLRSDPDNEAAAMMAYSFLAHHKMHPPIGPVLRHAAGVNSACGSPDGKWIVTAADKKVCVWSRPDHRLVTERVLDDGAVRALAASPNGTGIAAGTAKGLIHILSLPDLIVVREPVDTVSNDVNVLAWNPAGDVLGAGLAESANIEKGGGHLLRINAEGKELSRLHLARLSPLSLAWSADGGQLAACGSSPYFYNSTGDPAKPELKEMYSKLALAGLSFNEQGALRIIDVYPGLSTWDTASGKMIGRSTQLAPSPSRAAFSPDGKSFVGARRSPAAFIYESKDGSIPTEPISPGFTVTNGVWLDATHVLLYAENGMAQVRQIRPAVPAAKLGRFRTGYPDVNTLSPDGGIVAATYSSDPLVRFLDTRTLKEISQPVRFPSNIHAMAFLPDGRSLGALCWDGRFRRVEWRRALKFEESAGPLVPEITEMYYQVDTLRFHPSGALAAIPQGKGVMLIDTATGTLRPEIPVSDGAVAVGWSPDGKWLAVATHGQELHFMDSSGKPAAGCRSGKLNAPVLAVAWSPDGTRVAALTNNDRVDFFDPATGNPTAVSFPTGPSCTAILWVSSGRWLLTSDSDHVTKLWDPDTGIAVARMPKIAEEALRSQALDARGEVLLATASGFARVAVPEMVPPPEWLPPFLEAMGGAKLVSGKNEPLLDPDAWRSPAAKPAGGSNDKVWSPLRDWLLDERPDRPVFAGSDMTDSEAAKVLALDEQESRIAAMTKQMDALWKTNDEAKMAEAIELLDKALEIDPHLTRLQKTRRQIRSYSEKPAMNLESELAIIAAGDSSLLEVQEARIGAARAILQIDPVDFPVARKLADDVLAADPDNAAAKDLLEKIDAAGK
jgi:WD40 repeat protein